jgi:hypothetical protein
MKTDTNFWSYLAQFFLEWEIFQKKRRRTNQNTIFVYYFFPVIMP